MKSRDQRQRKMGKESKYDMSFLVAELKKRPMSGNEMLEILGIKTVGQKLTKQQANKYNNVLFILTANYNLADYGKRRYKIVTPQDYAEYEMQRRAKVLSALMEEKEQEE